MRGRLKWPRNVTDPVADPDTNDETSSAEPSVVLTQRNEQASYIVFVMVLILSCGNFL